MHLVNGIWGQISVGMFADPVSGPKGFFINGSTYQLKVQTISAISLVIWSGITTFLVIWSVNKISPIRLDEEEEMKGADHVEYTQMVIGERDPPLTSLPTHKKHVRAGKTNDFDDPTSHYDGLGHRKPFKNLDDILGYDSNENERY